MLVINNWVSCNLLDRLDNPSVNFSLNFTPYNFKPDTFENCSKKACLDIGKTHNNLYIGLSGGLDSEYILRTFKQYNIPIVPIIVIASSNTKEAQYAFKVCDELSIKPIVLPVEEEHLIASFYHYIKKPLNGVGYRASTAILAALYVKQVSGTIITGDHLLLEGDSLVSPDAFAATNEWDFYINCVVPEVKNINYFLYTPELLYSMIPNNGITWDHFRSKLYGIDYRKKIQPVFTDKAMEYFYRLNNTYPKHRSGIVYSQKEYLDIFDKYLI